MPASKHDFSIEQGSSFQMSLVHKDESGNPINIAGWCGRLVFKTGSGTVYTFVTNNTNYSEYRFTTDVAAGKLTLMLPASTTNSFNFNQAKYDLELQMPEDLYVGGGQKIIRVLYGTITIVKRFSQTSDQLSC
jgi:hypothetical protein